MIELEIYSTQEKSLKAIDNQKNLKHTLALSKFEEHKTYGVSKGIDKRYVCNLIIKVK